MKHEREIGEHFIYLMWFLQNLKWKHNFDEIKCKKNHTSENKGNFQKTRPKNGGLCGSR